MHEHYGLAPVEFLEDRVVSRMSQPLVVVAGHQSDPIRLEDTKRVFDFMQAAFGVRERYYGKATESARVTSMHIDQTTFREERCLRKGRPEASDTGTS